MNDEQIPIDEEIEMDEDGSSNEDSQFQIKKYDISSYPADYTITTILDKYNKAIIVPEFQRKYVWSKDVTKQSRLIESLLLGLPVPQIFLFQRKDDKNLLLIDGFQRLHTIHRYQANEFALEGVQEEWKNKRYSDLTSEDKEAFDNTTIRAIIIRQISPSDDYSSMYQIFERLNTGGMILSPMEIRKAIFYGPFVKNLELANLNNNWKAIINKKNSDVRLRDVEWVLRILAFYMDGVQKYQDPMKDYLTTFMDGVKSVAHDDVFALFAKACYKIEHEISKKPFHIISGRLNLAIMDSVILTVMKNINMKDLGPKYSQLISDAKYLELIKSRDATRAQNVKDRVAEVEKYLK